MIAPRLQNWFMTSVWFCQAHNSGKAIKVLDEHSQNLLGLLVMTPKNAPEPS